MVDLRKSLTDSYPFIAQGAMLIQFLNRALKSAQSGEDHAQYWFWLSLSLTFAVIYGSVALQTAFSGDYVVHDDARQHIFWMRRFLDPDLFPQDLIADYFESVAPLGFVAVYRFFAWFGLDPIGVHQLLPLGLSLVMTFYCYGVSIQILPVPAAGFISSLLLNQVSWSEDNLPSGTPRAFVYPLFLAFLYYLQRRSLIPCLIAIALLSLFYPHYTLIAIVILGLQLLRWQKGRPSLSRHGQDYRFCAVGMGMAILTMLPYVLADSPYNPVVTLAQAKQMPEFASYGRTAFFSDHFWEFWVTGPRSGIAPPIFPPLIWASVLLPLMWPLAKYFPLAKQVTNQVRVLPQVCVAAFTLFFAAHAVLFELHLPNRYTSHSLRMVMAIAAGMVLVMVLEPFVRSLVTTTQRLLTKQMLLAGFIIFLILSPLLDGRFGERAYIIGEEPEIYEFFAQQPKDIVVASVAMEARNIPTFSQRSVLVSREHAIPFHLGYYQTFRQRVLDLLAAQYSPDINILRQFTQHYGIDFWLLDKTTFTPTYPLINWITQYRPLVRRISRQLESGMEPALKQAIARCTLLTGKEVIVLDAQCSISRTDTIDQASMP